MSSEIPEFILKETLKYGIIERYNPSKYPINHRNNFEPKLYLGAALNHIFNHGHINIYQRDLSINLFNVFPLLKQRLATKQTIDNIIEIYMKINQVIFNPTDHWITNDQIFNDALNSHITAETYLYEDEDGYSRMPMIQAIEHGLISEALNTAEMLTEIQCEINNELYIERLKDLNYYQFCKINDADLINRLNEETKFSKLLLSVINLLNTPKIELKTVLTNRPFTGEQYYIVAYLIGHTANKITCPYQLRLRSWFKLLFGIYNVNIHHIILSKCDPRINNNEAYYAALEGGNHEVISVIRDLIIKRNWIEEQMYEQFCEPLCGPSDLPKCLAKIINAYNIL